MTQQLDAKKLCHKCSSRALYLENTCQKHYNEHKFWEVRHELMNVITIYVVRRQGKGYNLFYLGAPYKGADQQLIRISLGQTSNWDYWSKQNLEKDNTGYFYYREYDGEGHIQYEASGSELVHRLGEHLFKDGYKFKGRYLN